MKKILLEKLISQDHRSNIHGDSLLEIIKTDMKHLSKMFDLFQCSERMLLDLQSSKINIMGTIINLPEKNCKKVEKHRKI